MPKASNLYHSALRQLGPTRVTVKSDILKSKYPGKPDYVLLEIAGQEHYYSLENPGCGDVFDGKKGETFTVVADGGGRGKEDTATVTYVGESAEPSNDGGEAPPPARQPQRQAAPAQRRGPAPHEPKPAARAAAPAGNGGSVHHGARVGACLNKAVDYMIAEGVTFDANEIYNRTSDLVRIADALENGHMAPKFSERKAAQ